jgi:hypothetical protein
MLGQLAFEQVIALLGDEREKTEPPAGHTAWLEINETTGPPPEVTYHVLPNRTRLASGH